MLQSAGYEIASITGCSMGAVVGGMYCAGSLQLYKDWLCTLTKTSVFSLFDFTFTKQGFVKEKSAGQTQRAGGWSWNWESSGAFTAVATDMIIKEIHFTKGNLYKALRASICIPGIFTPVADEQHLMVDGGVKPATPQPGEKNNRAKNNCGQSHGAMPLPAGQQLTNGKPSSLSIISLLNNSYDLTQDRLTELMIQLFPPDILVEIPRNTCTAFEFYRAAELIEAGKQAWTKNTGTVKHSGWKTLSVFAGGYYLYSINLYCMSFWIMLCIMLVSVLLAESWITCCPAITPEPGKFLKPLLNCIVLGLSATLLVPLFLEIAQNKLMDDIRFDIHWTDTQSGRGENRHHAGKGCNKDSAGKLKSDTVYIKSGTKAKEAEDAGNSGKHYLLWSAYCLLAAAQVSGFINMLINNVVKEDQLNKVKSEKKSWRKKKTHQEQPDQPAKEDRQVREKDHVQYLGRNERCWY